MDDMRTAGFAVFGEVEEKPAVTAGFAAFVEVEEKPAVMGK